MGIFSWFKSTKSDPYRTSYETSGKEKKETSEKCQKKPPMDELEKLVRSKRYQDSVYVIQKINGEYALKRGEGKYVDLKSNSHTWNNTEHYFKDCLGTKKEVIDAFNYRVPVIVDLVIEKEYFFKES